MPVVQETLAPSKPRSGRVPVGQLPSENGQRRRLDKRARILKSAARIFARKGFYNTKISEIAHHAGVADGTIYLYFKNKDDVLISLFEDSMGKIIDEFKVKLTSLTDPVEKVRAFIALHFEIVRTNPDLSAVIQLELRQSNIFIKEYSGSYFSNYLDLISDIVREGQEAGVFRSDLMPGIIKRALFGALDEMSTLWVLSKDKNHDLNEAAKQITTLFLEGMLKTNSKSQKSNPKQTPKIKFQSNPNEQ